MLTVSRFRVFLRSRSDSFSKDLLNLSSNELANLFTHAIDSDSDLSQQFINLYTEDMDPDWWYQKILIFLSQDLKRER